MRYSGRGCPQPRHPGQSGVGQSGVQRRPQLPTTRACSKTSAALPAATCQVAAAARPPVRSASPRVAAGGTCCPASPATDKAAGGARPTQYLAELRPAPSVPARASSRAAASPPTATAAGPRRTPSPTRASPSSARCSRRTSTPTAALTSVNGYAAPGLTRVRRPRLSAAQAASRAVAACVKDPPGSPRRRRRDMTGHQGQQPELTVYRTGATEGVAGENRPCLRRRGAEPAQRARQWSSSTPQTGKVVNRYSMIDNDLDRELYEQTSDAGQPGLGRGRPLPGRP